MFNTNMAAMRIYEMKQQYHISECKEFYEIFVIVI